MPSVCEACGLALYRPDLADEHRATCPAWLAMLAVVEAWENPTPPSRRPGRREAVRV